MVIEEGGEARTINLFKLCHNAKLVQQGKQPLKSEEWKEVVEKEAHRGSVWKVFGSGQFLRRMWEFFYSQKRMGKEESGGRRSRKTGRKARSVATGDSLQRGFGASQKKCGHRLRSPDNAPCVQRNEPWQLDKVLRKNAGKKESSVNEPLKGFGRCTRRW